jgi:hypothetical protein
MMPTTTIAARSRGEIKKTGVLLVEHRRRERNEAVSGASRSGHPAVWSRLESHFRFPPWTK